MEIAVCVKQVPRPGSVGAAGDHLAWKEGHDADLNPFALNAVEAAIRVAERKKGRRVTVIAAGDASCEALLRAAVSIGAHRAVRVEAPALLRQDAQVLARALAKAVQELGDIDLVITGMHSAVGGPGLVPAMMAELLGWPLVSGVSSLDQVADEIAFMHRQSAEGLQRIRVEIPAVISVLREIADPRPPLAAQIKAAADMAIQVIAAPADAEPATNITYYDSPDPAPGVILPGDPAAAAAELAGALSRRGLI